MKSIKELYSICIKDEMGLTFDDVLLAPQYSDIDSRSEVAIHTPITKERRIGLPFISANMDTVTESKMAEILIRAGSAGVIHRYMSYEKQIEEVKKLSPPDSTGASYVIAAAVGIHNGVIEHAKNLVGAGANVIVVDVAHGFYKKVGDLVRSLVALNLVGPWNDPVEIIAGNVATYEATKFLCEAGASAVKVGVGPGSLCSTRVVTGHGVPQLLAICTASIAAAEYGVPIIADGGIRNSGDIVKALAAGASTVMCGSLFAGTEESPGDVYSDGTGKYKVYRGMASREAQAEFYGNDPEAPEGVSTTIPYKGPVTPIVTQLAAGIRSGLSYSGARNITELREKAEWLRVTSNGLRESVPHLLLK
jgi:IMP dehydrogenase